MDRDNEHLKLLGLFHYIYAGITACFSCFALIYVILGLMMLWMPPQNAREAPPVFVGCFMIVLGLAFFVIGLIYAYGNYLAGNFLKSHTHRTFCLITSGIACLAVPFGTVLGVSTIIVLCRDSVRNLFITQTPSPTV